MQIDEQIAMVIEPGEQVVWRGRPQWQSFMWHGPFWMLVVAAAYSLLFGIASLFNSSNFYVGAWLVPAIVLLLMVGWMMVRLGIMRSTWYALTDRRILLGRSLGMTPLSVELVDIIDAGIRKYPHAIMCGFRFGQVEFSTRSSYKQVRTRNSMSATYNPHRFEDIADGEQVLQLFRRSERGGDSETEKVLWQGGPDPAWSLVSPTQAFASLAVSIGYLIYSRATNGDMSGLLVGFVSLLGFWVMSYLVALVKVSYVVTNWGIVVKQGLFAKEVHSVAWSKVISVKTDRPTWMNFFGGDMGHISLLNGGQEKLEAAELMRSSSQLRCVPGVGGVVRIIQQQLEQSRMRKIEQAASADTVAP